MFAALRTVPASIGRRLVDLLGPTGDATRQSLTALAFNSTTSFAAGLCMAGMWATFNAHPSLLIMVTPAIGLRGNVFSTCGNRISTAIHMGTFEPNFKRGSVLRENTIAALVLSAGMSAALAWLAQGAAVLFGMGTTLPLGELAFVSIVGGTLASLIVLAATIALAVIGVRRDWDLDNLVAPSVSTLGDVITVPSLWIATFALGHRGPLVNIIGWAATALAVSSVGWALWSRRSGVRRIAAESLPVLAAAAVLSGLGGLVVSSQLKTFDAFPALLILVPAFVSSLGALGGILGSRVSTNLHLGVVEPHISPDPAVRTDIAMVALLAAPIMVFNVVGALLLGTLVHQAAPSALLTFAGTAIASAVAFVFVVSLSYYGTVAAWRFELDPDTYGVPTVTAAVDFVGASALILALVVLHAV